MPEALTQADLLRYRSTIDNLDAALVHLLAERFRATRAIGIIKASANIPSVDPEREAAQTVRLRAMAEQAGLSPDFAEHLFRVIVTQVTEEHEAIRSASEQA